MIDTHCHLNDDWYLGEVDRIVDNYLSANVDKVICIGCNSESNKRAKEIAERFASVYYSVGVHPDECATYDEIELEAFLKAKDPKLVAVGEIGLDYYTRGEEIKDKNKQIEVFASQLRLANKYNLPVVIHCRDAYGDTLEVLKGNLPKAGFVFHCYSGSLEYARELISLGGKVSFTGSVTFKNAKNIQNVALNIPSGSFFFETDSPYLSPEPYRGQRNEPSRVVEVAKFVANLRGEDEKTLIKHTDTVAKEFFKIH